jgi:hypothetical protein
MPAVPPDAVILQVSPALPGRQVFDGPGLQVLAGPTHLLVSMQGLLACETVHANGGKAHLLLAVLQEPEPVLQDPLDLQSLLLVQ